MKIAFFALNQNFCGTILEEMRAHHTVRMWKKIKIPHRDWANVVGLLNWCDVAYFDFIQTPLPEVSQFQFLERGKPFIVARMDGIDILNHDAIDWKRVDALVLMPVQEKRLKRLRALHKSNYPNRTLPPLPKKILKRNVGIDLQMFRPDLKREPGYEIVLHSSVIRETKRVYTALQCFYELVTQDPEKPWKLWLIGQWAGGWKWPQRMEYVMCVGELVESLNFPKGRLILQMENFPRPAWAEFIRGRDLYWCTSFREGFPNSMGEAAASGVYPLSNRWFGAELLYPEECLWRTPSELVRKTIEWGNFFNEDKIRLRYSTRGHIEQYSRRQTAIDIRQLCEEVVGI